MQLNAELAGATIDPGSPNQKTRYRGLAPVHVAAMCASQPITPFMALRNYGADLTLTTTEGYNALHFVQVNADDTRAAATLTDAGLCPFTPTACGESPLQWAVYYGRRKVIDFFLTMPQARPGEGSILTAFFAAFGSSPCGALATSLFKGYVVPLHERQARQV